ncbi:MAG: redoxin domain-containing protein [Alphaproteobacteria bacterium]|nr:redoxin domain-containing protein [Alphaproteobacteria bacterium]
MEGHMRTLGRFLAAAAFAAVAGFAVDRATAVPSATVAKPGERAPSLSAPDIAGKNIRLGDYAGKIVVLEWTNDGCPFVGKHYDSGNMQGVQQKYTTTGVVWLTIASSAPGEQGYVTPAEAKSDLARWHAAPTDFLLDPEGMVGRLYDARATPHMVVIDRSGRVAYMGAIDDKPSTRFADVRTAHNYVAAALDAIAAGQPVAVTSTRAYGCSIKYKDE